MRNPICVSVFSGVIVGAFCLPVEADGEVLSDDLRRGREVYLEHCAGCHGVGGDGKGADRILDSIRPPDFTMGDVRYKSTPPGAPPTDLDLSVTIARGVPRSSMPHHNFLGEAERRAVVRYVSGFFPEWSENETAEPVELPPKPKYFTSASVTRGRQVYDLLGCADCHGPDGTGSGSAAGELPPNSRGIRQSPIDLNRTALKAGGRMGDIFRTLVIGLNGTAMEPYASQLLQPDGKLLQEYDGWYLVYYLRGLKQSGM